MDQENKGKVEKCNSEGLHRKLSEAPRKNASTIDAILSALFDVRIKISLRLSYCTKVNPRHTIRTLPGLAFAKSDNTQPQDLVTDTTEDKTLAYINNLSHFQNRKSDKNDPIAFSYHRGILSACLGSISYRTQSQKAENEGDSTRMYNHFQFMDILSLILTSHPRLPYLFSTAFLDFQQNMGNVFESSFEWMEDIPSDKKCSTL